MLWISYIQEKIFFEVTTRKCFVISRSLQNTDKKCQHFSKIFKNIFKTSFLCSPSLDLFDKKKYNKNSDIVKHYIIKIIVFCFNIFQM